MPEAKSRAPLTTVHFTSFGSLLLPSQCSGCGEHGAQVLVKCWCLRAGAPLRPLTKHPKAHACPCRGSTRGLLLAGLSTWSWGWTTKSACHRRLTTTRKWVWSLMLWCLILWCLILWCLMLCGASSCGASSYGASSCGASSLPGGVKRSKRLWSRWHYWHYCFYRPCSHSTWLQTPDQRALSPAQQSAAYSLAEMLKSLGEMQKQVGAAGNEGVTHTASPLFHWGPVWLCADRSCRSCGMISLSCEDCAMLNIHRGAPAPTGAAAGCHGAGRAAHRGSRLRQDGGWVQGYCRLSSYMK